MPDYPGVYVEELPPIPLSVVGVATNVPAFLGYTEKAEEPESGRSLTGTPYPIASMAEYEQAFGGAYSGPVAASGGVRPFLHDALNLYFANGGSGTAWIVSAGDYPALESGMSAGALDPGRLKSALQAIAALKGPTLLAAPEAVLMSDIDYHAVAASMLGQAAALRDRFVILDLPGDPAAGPAPVKSFQQALSALDDVRSFGAAYFPPLKLASGSVVPPSGAVLGAIVANDIRRGVWKAPANLSLKGVSAPAVPISNRQQESMNAPPSGVSVNAIRGFVGRGTLIWGARTLDGHSNEWRYISVRRFASFVEESVRDAIEPFVFEPNDANSWLKIRAMIENFLLGLWRQGALMGAKPDYAFYVAAGLGRTMTEQDVNDGRLIVEVGMACVRPAEFIVLRLSQIMRRATDAGYTATGAAMCGCGSYPTISKSS